MELPALKSNKTGTTAPDSQTITQKLISLLEESPFSPITSLDTQYNSNYSSEAITTDLTPKSSKQVLDLSKDSRESKSSFNPHTRPKNDKPEASDGCLIQHKYELSEKESDLSLLDNSDLNTSNALNWHKVDPSYTESSCEESSELTFVLKPEIQKIELDSFAGTPSPRKIPFKAPKIKRKPTVVGRLMQGPKKDKKSLKSSFDSSEVLMNSDRDSEFLTRREGVLGHDESSNTSFKAELARLARELDQEVEQPKFREKSYLGDSGENLGEKEAGEDPIDGCDRSERLFWSAKVSEKVNKPKDAKLIAKKIAQKRGGLGRDKSSDEACKQKKALKKVIRKLKHSATRNRISGGKVQKSGKERLDLGNGMQKRVGNVSCKVGKGKDFQKTKTELKMSKKRFLAEKGKLSSNQLQKRGSRAKNPAKKRPQVSQNGSILANTFDQKQQKKSVSRSSRVSSTTSRVKRRVSRLAKKSQKRRMGGSSDFCQSYYLGKNLAQATSMERFRAVPGASEGDCNDSSPVSFKKEQSCTERPKISKLTVKRARSNKSGVVRLEDDWRPEEGKVTSRKLNFGPKKSKNSKNLKNEKSDKKSKNEAVASGRLNSFGGRRVSRVSHSVSQSANGLISPEIAKMANSYRKWLETQKSTTKAPRPLKRIHSTRKSGCSLKSRNKSTSRPKLNQISTSRPKLTEKRSSFTKSQQRFYHASLLSLSRSRHLHNAQTKENSILSLSLTQSNFKPHFGSVVQAAGAPGPRYGAQFGNKISISVNNSRVEGFGGRGRGVRFSRFSSRAEHY